MQFIGGANVNSAKDASVHTNESRNQSLWSSSVTNVEKPSTGRNFLPASAKPVRSVRCPLARSKTLSKRLSRNCIGRANRKVQVASLESWFLEARPWWRRLAIYASAGFHPHSTN